eukprot:scaffold13542_cov58-Phaeocystis_antarctica.AAC.1
MAMAKIDDTTRCALPLPMVRKPNLQPVRVAAVEVVLHQPLVAHKPEALVQAERAHVSDLRLEHRLLAPVVVHALHRERHELAPHASLAHAA